MHEQQVEEWAKKIIYMLHKKNVRTSEGLDIFQTLLGNTLCMAKTKEMAVQALTEFCQEALNMIAKEYKDKANE